MPSSTASFASLADVAVPFAPPSPTAWPDTAVIEAQRTLAEIRRRVDAAAAVIAAEIAHRSRAELGHDGLAQRLGARTAQHLVQTVTGASSRDAGTLVRAGTLISTGPAWLAEVGAAAARGGLSLDAAEAIRTGLGEPTQVVSAAELADAARHLLAIAPTVTPERLAALARDRRAELDHDGIADAEQALRERRYLHLSKQADGMTRLVGLLDPESAAIVASAYDAATSPRRGGPRFVDPATAAAADRLADDPRSTEQLALDSLVELIRIGAAADDGTVLAARPAHVTLHVALADLESGRGLARFEGQSAPVSIQTAQRRACESALTAVLFDDDGAVLNTGRDQRLYNRRQRRALAARDGGCRFPGCDRPPSWTEAHHIVEWSRGGRTDLADGVLLCRHHHLLLHNNGWQIIRRGAEYLVVPPRDVDPLQRPISAPPKFLLGRAS